MRRSALDEGGMCLMEVIVDLGVENVFRCGGDSRLVFGPIESS